MAETLSHKSMTFEKDKNGNDKFMFECPTCRSKYQHGPQIYQGRTLSGYELQVCQVCYEGNWDGWTSQHNKFLLARCEEIGIDPPRYNSKGWLPREF